ncbi:ATP-binding protein [Oribacterium sp. oral taxon 102]|uniref:ATP-binding protein n=1 Tax=Oribacterium sp. oral taxon 102 TaxID=671214 RepID=UPI002ED3BB7D
MRKGAPTFRKRRGKMARRLASVDRRRCVSCGACENTCPRNAIRVWKGLFARVEGSLCIGCTLCARVCPAVCIDMRERSVE